MTRDDRTGSAREEVRRLRTELSAARLERDALRGGVDPSPRASFGAAVGVGAFTAAVLAVVLGVRLLLEIFAHGGR